MTTQDHSSRAWKVFSVDDFVPHQEGECRFCDEMREDIKKALKKPAQDDGPRLRDLGPGPSLGVVTKADLPPRVVDDLDLKRNNIPLVYKSATLAGIQDEKIRPVVERYLSKLPELVRACTGLLITGNPGVGKSAIASMIAIEAIKHRFSVYMVTHSKLQELRFDDKPAVNSDGQSPTDCIQYSDLLILDDFNESFLTDKVFGPAKLETLIAERNRWLKTTIMTTRLAPALFKKESALRSLYGVMQETMVGLVLGGDDYRVRKNQEMKNRLGIVK